MKIVEMNQHTITIIQKLYGGIYQLVARKISILIIVTTIQLTNTDLIDRA